MDPTFQGVQASACTKGQYSKPIEGGDQCNDCPKGYFANTDTATECAACTSNYFAHRTASTECNACASFSCSSEHAVANKTKQDQCAKDMLPCDVCQPGSHYDKVLERCSACPDGSVNPEANQTECKACGRDKYTPDGLECKECPEGMVPNDAHTTCVDRNTEAAVPVWIIEGYAGLLMVVGMLNAIASTTLNANNKPMAFIFGIVTGLITLGIIIAMTYTIGATTPSTGQNGYITIVVTCVYGVMIIVSWIIICLDHHIGAKETAKLTGAKSAVLKDIGNFFSERHGILFSAAILAFLIFTAFRVSPPGEASYLRRYDVSIMLTMQVMIQVELYFLLRNVEGSTGHKINSVPLLAITFLMLFHAVAFPIAIVRRIRSAPKDEEIHPSQLTNLHYIADFHGLMGAGMAVCLMIFEKSREKEDETNESVSDFKRASDMIEQVVMDRKCRSGPRSERIDNWNRDSVDSIRLRVHQVVDEMEEEDVCRLGDAVLARSMSAMKWSVLKISQCSRLDKTTEVDFGALQPLDVCYKVSEGARDFSKVLVAEANEIQKSTIHISSKFAVMTLVADAYYGALYNVADMANAMTAQDDVMANMWLDGGIGLLPNIMFFIYIAIRMFKHGGSDRIVSQGNRMGCSGKYIDDREERCANGFVKQDEDCPKDTPCLKCPRDRPYSHAPPVNQNGQHLLCIECRADKHVCHGGSVFDVEKCRALEDPPLCSCPQDKKYWVDSINKCTACTKEDFPPCPSGTRFSKTKCRDNKDVCVPCKVDEPYSDGHGGDCVACDDDLINTCQPGQYFSMRTCTNPSDNLENGVADVCKACKRPEQYSYKGAVGHGECNDCEPESNKGKCKDGDVFSKTQCKRRNEKTDSVCKKCPDEKPNSDADGLHCIA